MSFWDNHVVADSTSGYLSADEKADLATAETPFQITGVKYDEENKYGPRFVLTITLPDAITGEEETRLVGFPQGSGVGSRDDLFRAMIDDHFGAGVKDAIPAVIVKAGNAYLIKPAA